MKLTEGDEIVAGITLTTTRDRARSNGHVQRMLTQLGLHVTALETRFNGQRVSIHAQTDGVEDEAAVAGELRELFNTQDVSVVTPEKEATSNEPGTDHSDKRRRTGRRDRVHRPAAPAAGDLGAEAGVSAREATE